MKEHPILFSGPMVTAILAGRKTQTRRIVKSDVHAFGLDAGREDAMREGYAWFQANGDDLPGNHLVTSPYGGPGGRLWVRENLKYDWKTEDWRYRADDQRVSEHHQPVRPRPDRWPLGIVNSIHMPRDVCRIELEVVAVRVERLQDISGADAHAEGIERDTTGNFVCRADPVLGYRTLWEQINGHGSWGHNPWVWVIEFKRVDQVLP
jgi:hypothetical protein